MTGLIKGEELQINQEMIATEFRLGNYLHDREGRLCLVEELSCRKGEREIYAPAITGPTTGLPNKPISITGEWLLKFGFEEVEKTAFRIDVLPYGRITFYTNGMICELGQSRGYKLGEPDIKYVHQLQNLYHALTGEELQLTN